MRRCWVLQLAERQWWMLPVRGRQPRTSRNVEASCLFLVVLNLNTRNLSARNNNNELDGSNSNQWSTQVDLSRYSLVKVSYDAFDTECKSELMFSQQAIKWELIGLMACSGFSDNRDSMEQVEGIPYTIAPPAKQKATCSCRMLPCLVCLCCGKETRM